MQIRPYTPDDLDAVVQLSLRAWAPVFDSLQKVMDDAVFNHSHPNGWRITQAKAVEVTCNTEHVSVWVATEADAVVGFVATALHEADSMGEIYMIAVDPAAQGQGIGAALMDFAEAQLRDAGMEVIMVETGGDPGHAPARHLYKKMGFGLLPIARYFKKL